MPGKTVNLSEMLLVVGEDNIVTHCCYVNRCRVL